MLGVIINGRVITYYITFGNTFCITFGLTFGRVCPDAGAGR